MPRVPTTYELDKAYKAIYKKPPSQEVLEAIAQSDLFKEYSQACMTTPIANAFLGCIEMGYRIREKIAEMEAEERIHLA